MIWLSDPTTRADRLPAAWLIETGQHPASLTERRVLRRSAATRIIATQFGETAEGAGLGHGPSGRPRIAGWPAVGISYATRGGLILVALGYGDIGADLEIIEPLADIPWNVLHPAERRHLAGLTVSERNGAFYTLWCAKEAYLKAAGTGLDREPSAFAIDMAGETAWSADRPDMIIETRQCRAGGRDCAVAVAFTRAADGHRAPSAT